MNAQFITTRGYANTMRRLAKSAPTMPVKEAASIANELAEYAADSYLANAALVILAEPLGIDTHGNLPDNLKAIDDKAIKWALDKLLLSHCGSCCSPFSDGVEGLKKRAATWSKPSP